MAEDFKVHDGKKPEKVEDKTSSVSPDTENSKIVEKKAEEKKKPEKSDSKTGSAKAESHKKNEAVVNGRNLSMGIKHAMALCNYIRGKEIDTAIAMVDEVVHMRKAIPMRGEIPHRHGMMSGRYPVKAAGIMIVLLKSLKSNAIQHELELEKFKIFAMPNVAPRPYKKFGAGRFKRTHITIKLIPINKPNKEKKK